MGKTRKKKQKKTADFQKVKLKVGKKKPTGTNVTNTAFKTLSINIASQLQKESNGPTNKKQLSLKELLTQLNHYNVTVRHDALMGLLELFQMHANVVHDEIGVWLSKIFEKAIDTDAAVRHAAQLCLNFSFNQLNSDEVLPFFKIIVAHVCCGMTHINSGVQLDMLNILDLILSNYPKHFVQHCNKLLTHFMDLISKQTSKEKSSNHSMKTTKVRGISAMVSRELSIDMKSQLSSLKVRSQVLEKLHKMLRILYTHGQGRKEETVSEKNKEFFAVSNSSIYIQLPNRQTDFLSTDMETWLSFSSAEDINNATFGDLDIKDFIQCVFPVLLNSWVEYEPGQLSSCLADSNTLRTSLPGMKAIIEIIDILIQLLNETKNNDSNFSFSNNYFKDLSTHFLYYFALPIMKSKQKKQTKSINKIAKADPLQLFAIEFNFVMSQIVCNILSETSTINGNNQLDAKLKTRYVKQLVSFVMDVLDNSVLLNDEKVEQFMDTVKDLMRIKINLCTKEGQVIEVSNLLKQLVKNFTQASVSSPWKIPIMHYFLELLTQSKLDYMCNRSCVKHVEEFVKVLVTNVWSIPSTSKKLIQESFFFIKTVFVYKIQHLVNEEILKNTLLKITELQHGLFCDVDEKIQRLIIEIIYSMKTISNDVIKNLSLLCHSTKVTMATKKYIISMLGYCLEKDGCDFEKENFINFIMSAVLGYSRDDLLKFNNENTNLASWCVIGIITTEDYIIQDVLVDYAVDQLKRFKCDMFWIQLVPPIARMIVMLRCIPLRSGYGLVKLLEKLSEWYHQTDVSVVPSASIGSEINQLADLISAVLLFAYSPTYKAIHNDNSKAVEIYELVASCLNLLANNEGLLAWLVKKYVNIIEEYKMDSTCIACIVEVLLSLLQETRIQTKLIPLKENLQTIVTTLNTESSLSSIVQKSLFDQFKLHLSLL